MVNASSTSLTPAKHADNHKTGGTDPLTDPITVTGHHTTHESGGSDEIAGFCSAPETLVRSGSSPTAWTDVDCSAVVGSNKAYVIFKLSNASGVIYVNLRPKGTANPVIPGTDAGIGISVCRLTTGKVYYLGCMTDANGVIQVHHHDNVRTSNLYVHAYWVIS
jgi:hypothetical protein